ncbi:hypothetical protein DPSP01_002862 [Paraphaeosphaeria sporulosa]
MGFFSRAKKSAPTTAKTVHEPAQVDPRVARYFSANPTGFYKHAQKNKDGTPIASQMYWNTNPPTKDPELHSIFDVDGNNVDVERYDSRDNRPGVDRTPTYIFNREYGAGAKGADTVRPVGRTPDYALIRSWLGQCDKEHKQCQPRSDARKLKTITLIDVRNRRLVPYKPGSQYVALSYVWGGVESPKRTGRPDDLPINISMTILHAMLVTENLGVRFLWADAVCINQHDPKEKEQQLPLMDYIYEQAFATIVALGDNANTGLPGVKGGPIRWPQLVAEFGSVRLLSRCPTLSAEIHTSRWSTRGWTYQEGLFSRRCIFFTGHQVYFHCNAMFCSEDSPMAIKYPKIEIGRLPSALKYNYHTQDVNYIRPYILLATRMEALAHNNGRMSLLAEYVGEYIRREVSHDADAINAFGALLSRLERDFFPGGFVHGIPRDEFVNGLLWTAFYPSRREGGGFPSWSWAGWKVPNGGNIEYSLSSIKITGFTSIPVPLRMSLGGNQLCPPSTSPARLSGLGLELQHLWEIYHTNTKNFKAPIAPSSLSFTGTALAIDGPVMRLPIAYEAATQAIRFVAPTKLPYVHQRPPPPLLPGLNAPPEKRDFLVLRTTHQQENGENCVRFQLMLLKWEADGVRTRAGLLTLDVERDLRIFWQCSGVRRDAFSLV